MEVQLWDLRTGKELRRFPVPEPYFFSPNLAFSPDGKLLAWSAASTKVYLWEVATGKELPRRIAGAGPAFSPDGSILATGAKGEEGIFTLWEVATGKILASNKGAKCPKGEICRLAFSPDGRLLATTAEDDKIWLWCLHRDGTSIRVDPAPLVIQCPGSISPGWMVSLVFSPDGRMLATNDPHRGGVHLYEVASGRKRHRLEGHEGSGYSVTSLAFSPDGRRLASGSIDTTVLVWDVTGRLDKGRLRPAQLSDKDLERLWADLTSDDAGRAYRAVWTLAAASAQVVPFLQKQLRPVPNIDPEVVAQLIARLDDDAFTVRRKALSELKKLGEVAEPALRRALEQKPSVEMRRRLQELLSTLEEERKAPSREMLRDVRAVEVLEQIGTLDARRVLEVLSRGAPGILQREAQAALGRLDRK
jgi:hypothetical protein